MKMKNIKYKNVKTTVDGIKFDSKKEAARYSELKLLQKLGKIKSLELQKVFVLAPSVVINGRKRPPLKYICDFYYVDGLRGFVVEDVKGVKTASYVIKRHLMMSTLGIKINEI